jgi:hypothetical protein
MISRAARSAFLCLAALMLVSLAACGGGAAGTTEYSLVGDWVQMKTSAPHRDVVSFGADGTFTTFIDYVQEHKAESQFETWSLSGSTLTLAGFDAEIQVAVTWINENSVKMTVPERGDIYAYRKGFEPGGNILAHAPISLTVDTYTEGSLGFEESVLYKFQAPSGPFFVRCHDSQNGEGFTGRVRVTLYDAEGGIVLEEFGSSDAQSEQYLEGGSTCFIVVDCGVGDTPGDFEIGVQGSY